MKKLLLVLLLLITFKSYGQQDEQRIQNIKNQLEILSTETIGLTENVKTEINVNNISLSNLLLAVSNIHKVNINVAPELNQISTANNFTNVTVTDLLVFLCKEYNLTIDFTGNILSIKKYIKEPEKPEERVIPIDFSPSNNNISINIKGDKLYDVFKRIMDETGKNLVFTPDIENKSLTAYIQNIPFDTAMDKLAFANNLYVEESKDGFFVFEQGLESSMSQNGSNTDLLRQRPIKRRKSNFFFEVKNAEKQLLEVDFTNTPIADIIYDIGNALNIDIFTATPLDEAGIATVKAKRITFDELLLKLFEINITNNTSNQVVQSNQSNENQSQTKKFNFKKDNNIYFFGVENQLSIRTAEVIQLQHRSIELLADPNRSFGSGANNNSFNQNTTSFNNGNNQFDNFSNGNNRQNINSNNQNFPNNSNKVEALVNILPDEITKDLDIKVDYELNSFYVTGTSANVNRFKDFINKIDQIVPVILIEVMIIEVNRTNTFEAGVTWGIAEEPTITQGNLYPTTDLTLGSKTVNRIIGGFNGFGGFNLGKVVPGFFATIKAMETNGDLKVRSTPKISTMNGHRAFFSNGQETYFAVTQRNIYGTDNPQTSEITNYQSIDAQLGLTIKPMVSGDGQVTLDISVIQSSFGARIADDAPPDINSREFSSIIRMKDQDIAILGGLEEQMKSNSGSGVPFLARIPIIKYLFSKRVRTAKKSKLTVLIRPTIIN